MEAWEGRSQRQKERMECGTELSQEKNPLSSWTPELHSVGRGTSVALSDCGVPTRVPLKITVLRQLCPFRPGFGVWLLPGWRLGAHVPPPGDSHAATPVWPARTLWSG